MVVLPVQIVTGHLQPADVSFAVKGSGEFTENALPSVSEQIRLGKAQTAEKITWEHYIAYFQAFTNIMHQ